MHGKKLTFPLDSAQAELLLSFESTSSLSDLADSVGRDSSVVSRQLQKLAETAPVIEKYQGKWRITEVGKQINRWTRSAIFSQHRILTKTAPEDAGVLPAWFDQAALLVVGMQKGFDHVMWGKRNNPDAERNVESLIQHWRKGGRQVIHFQHVSKFPVSPLQEGHAGIAFKECAVPVGSERVVRKSSNSGFVGTSLEAELRANGIETLILVGFTTNLCVDATARDAAALGFQVYIVSDATVAFDRTTPDGKRLAADDVHSVVLANLHHEFGVVVKTDDLLKN